MDNQGKEGKENPSCGDVIAPRTQAVLPVLVLEDVEEFLDGIAGSVVGQDVRSLGV